MGRTPGRSARRYVRARSVQPYSPGLARRHHNPLSQSLTDGCSRTTFIVEHARVPDEHRAIDSSKEHGSIDDRKGAWRKWDGATESKKQKQIQRDHHAQGEVNLSKALARTGGEGEQRNCEIQVVLMYGHPQHKVGVDNERAERTEQRQVARLSCL